LNAMASALENQVELKNSQELNFEDRLGILVDAQIAAQDSKNLKSRLQAANLRLSACIEDLDVKASRGLDRAVISSLSTSAWIQRTRNVIIEGKTGVGKTFLGCALAQQACRNGYKSFYIRAPALFEELAVARAAGSFKRLLASIAKKHLLVLDDFALAPLTDSQRRDLLEIVEQRYERSSTIFVSQMPQEHWHKIIGDPTIADAILDRVVHNAQTLILKGESIRKTKAASNG
jgi:DNA replication protein DnaC